MALITSEAAFAQRCGEISPDGSLHAALVGQGLKNFRQLAFSIGTPRVEPTAEQYTQLATQVFGASPAIGQIATLRDLHFESTTYVVQVFKEQASADGSEAQIKKLPMPERTARALDQQRRLSGISIVGELQPSFQLVDKCNTMIETGALVWLAPSVCSKRDSEVSIGLHDRSPVVQLEKDSLKLAAPSQRIPVDVSTPLTLQWAWQRRGIALDQCGLITWHMHEAYVQRLLNFLTAPVPSGWTPVRTEQLIRADKEVWTLLAREVRPPYKTLPDGSKPLDDPFKNMFFDQRIQVWLAPVMSGAPAPSSSSTADAQVPAPPAPPEGPTRAPKKKIRKKARLLMPEAFKKCPKFSKGPVCWGFNGEGCSAETKTVDSLPRCAKGFHVCMQCHKANHSFATCRSRKA